MDTPFGPVVDVFCFVPDLAAATTWYTARLGAPPARRSRRLVSFDLGGSRLTLHVADGYNSGGPDGCVAYWDVEDVDRVAEEWIGQGAAVHRGPTTVGTGERLCQLRDPFGNLIGVRQAPVPAEPAHRWDAPVPMTEVPVGGHF
ncbi:VOC family protein [Blastococcus xanthinilyticus]|uniref:Putative enzyme related to lactoylglutathione lyase n=1 Tax=Blastococcus xanthinilyticus TaxID=1564164 RepID=A0A5S5D2G5_9ACTN|nr:VOC family protein [Blastococcus xanthinilyticus]TYP88992.1 putative enzyme related to lactoylglutathione lyase [Blastococcus xanthinilyticus]